MKPLLTAMVFIFMGCSSATADTLNLSGVDGGPQEASVPLVLVPGALGSRLRDRDTNEELWPGGLASFLFAKRFDALALDIDPDTLRPKPGGAEPYAAFEGFDGRRHYARVRKALAETAGYAPGVPGERYEVGDRRYYLFTYDWRQDIVENAARLDQFIERVRRAYGEPRLKVDIVAHSMGALVVRYFLQYGSANVLDAAVFTPTYAGAAKVRQVSLLGAPNMGSLSMLQTLVHGRRFGLAKLQPEVLLTMPAAYELLPHPGLRWAVAPDGAGTGRDLYSLRTWRELRWSIFDPRVRKRVQRAAASPSQGEQRLELLERYFGTWLARAKRFHAALSVALDPERVRYSVFGGDCVVTPARYVLERTPGGLQARRHPGEIAHPVAGVDYRHLMFEPGDGLVTRSSVLGESTSGAGALPLNSASFACERHGRLPASARFERALLGALTPHPVPLPQGEREQRKQEPHPLVTFSPGGLNSVAPSAL